MSVLRKLVVRSKASGEGPLGIAMDAFAYGMAHITRGMKMNSFFLYKDMQKNRWAYRKYASDQESEMLRRLNPPEVIRLFSEKDLFNARFGRFLGREWLDVRKATPEELYAFLKRHPDAIAKPRAGKGGTGVEQLALPAGLEICRALHDRLVEQDMLVEEHIQQHAEVSRLYPHAVNTIRITTFLTEKGPVVVAPLMRVGSGGSIADNFDSGGVLTMLDPESGAMLSGAMNKQYVWFDKHPETGANFVGFRVPCWQEALALCREAALVEPRAVYIGWDVAITEKGPVLVEGNSRPSINWQCVDRRGWRRELLAAGASAKRRQETK